MEIENDKIKLSHYIDLCLSFSQDPSEQNKTLLDDYLAKLQVTPYMALKDKILTLGEIIYTLPKDYDAAGDAAHIEITKITKGLLSYIINLENDVPEVSTTYTLYDIIIQYGMYDMVIQYCEKDFERLNKMIDDTFNFDNIYKLITSIQFFDNTSYDNWVKAMKDMQTTLTPEMLEAIKTLNKVNATELTDGINKITQEVVLKEINDTLTKEQEENTKKDLTE